MILGSALLMFLTLGLYFCELSCPSIETLEVGSCFDAQKSKPAVVSFVHHSFTSTRNQIRNTITRSACPLMPELKRHLCGSLCAIEDLILSYFALCA